MTEALYRKYRSQEFDALVGQDHITKVLKHQVKAGEISHAYLFTGTRGTGKTSAAKILARAVNCLNPREGNPCNTCENCVGILGERWLDVVEMDAASNNSVDDIRDLKDKVIYAPAVLRYRVYIIDEVHMLSKGAFNALLKILEEPPSHLIFILATTEPERIPATILSRCQRYDFHRIKPEVMMDHMADVVRAEGRQVEDGVLRLIARHADGAMRDALSLLDQCLSLVDEPISYDGALSVLGMTDERQLLGLAKAIMEKDRRATLHKIGDLRNQGKDVHQLMVDFISFYRQWLNVYMLDTIPETMEEGFYKELKMLEKDQALEDLLLRIEELIRGQNLMKWAPQPEVILEMTLLRLMDPVRLDATAQVRELERRIKVLESGAVFSPKSDQALTKQKKAEVSEPKPQKNQTTEMELEEVGRGIKKEPPMEVFRDQEEKPRDARPEPLVREGVQEKPVAMRRGALEAERGIDQAQWEDYCNEVKKVSIPTEALLKEATPLQRTEEALTIGFEENFGFHYNALGKERHMEAMKKAAKALWKNDIEVRLELMKQTEADRRQQAIDRVVEYFGDDIVEIQ